MSESAPGLHLQPAVLSWMELFRSHAVIGMVINHEGLSDTFDAKTPLDWFEIGMNTSLAHWANHNHWTQHLLEWGQQAQFKTD